MHPTLGKYANNQYFMDSAVTGFNEKLEEIKGNKQKLLDLQARLVTLREIYPPEMYKIFTQSVVNALKGL